MHITLPQELEAYLAQQAQFGKTPDEIIAESLALKQQQDAWLRAEIQKGLDSGEPEEWDLEAFKTRCRIKFGVGDATS